MEERDIHMRNNRKVPLATTIADSVKYLNTRHPVLPLLGQSSLIRACATPLTILVLYFVTAATRVTTAIFGNVIILAFIIYLVPVLFSSLSAIFSYIFYRIVTSIAAFLTSSVKFIFSKIDFVGMVLSFGSFVSPIGFPKAVNACSSWFAVEEEGEDLPGWTVDEQNIATEHAPISGFLRRRSVCAADFSDSDFD
ncbi:uncharacterized protein LOC116608376 [Nematostella vectensis]|uniref:uncharacterized protein LOC116608376 n=1 Tax=Nematostella vectensis TaxID=45351 RepID=UPI0013906DCB|nr:uncharacterized protein LOC116608376 [Nematostella vectensis]